jgi:Flp pilus assembly pilin Flp
MLNTNKNLSILAAFYADEQGMETIVWLLLLGVVILPMAALILKISIAIGRYYSFVSQTLTMPFL